MEYGGFWIRFGAYLIDLIILSVVYVIVFAILAALDARGAPWVLAAIAVGALYFVGFWIAEGATPGKMAFGLVIRMADGRPPTTGAAALRYLGVLICNWVPLLYLVIVFNSEKRGLHDYIGGTVVVRKK